MTSTSSTFWIRVAIAVTVLAWLAYLIPSFVVPLVVTGTATSDSISYLIVMTFFAFALVMYLLARRSALRRHGRHRAPDRLESHFATTQGSTTVLVPPYTEELTDVRASVWAAALQEYPKLRVVLLLDDPPRPLEAHIAARLDESRTITDRVTLVLAEPSRRFRDELLACEIRLAESSLIAPEAVRDLAESYRFAIERLAAEAAEERAAGGDAVAKVLDDTAHELSRLTRSLHVAIADERRVPPAERMLELHQRLAWTFSVDLDTFELDFRRTKSRQPRARASTELSAGATIRA